MNCEELRQNTAAYALGALSGTEQAEFENHIAECDLDHEIESFSEVTSRLSYATPMIEPPAGLRDRILNAAAADITPRRMPSSASTASTSWIQRVQRRGAPVYGAAAVMLIVFGALVGWGVASITNDDPSIEINHFRRDPEGDWLRVESVLGKNGLSLSVGNLQTLEGESTYQFWVVRNDRWVPVGEFNTNVENRWSGYFEFALEIGDSVAITIEPEPGSETPSSEAEIQSRI